MDTMTPADAMSAPKSPFQATYGNFIGGKFVPALSGRTFENISPVTGHGIGEGGVKAARKRRGRRTGCAQRGEVLHER